ncbi:hypothetical protein [Bradyrhizobium sp. Arg816]|uniref:hypothetical protein n=1 Tax=Bradyrhizobium sp. Arg816 TaxID=2998491 RepID=UPI00249EE2CE|nr:hypothetical protein [Bradyrhizobium sp. Arg816]MDI3561205.1 hypothetical protein [Bradyrhizobium sp. Arg816]
MTSYDTKRLRCYCCGKTSEQTILMSTNSFGSPDLDQRSAGMERSTIDTWLQECPFCGYVAFDLEKGDERAMTFVETAEFRAASTDPSPDPVERRFLARAAFDVHCGDRRAAFLSTLSAAWVADDRKALSEATALRLKAAAHLAGHRIRSMDTRLLLLDVLRRASSWEAADALTTELIAEELEHPFAEIVSFHRERIEAKDNGRYTIAEALAGKSKAAG